MKSIALGIVMALCLGCDLMPEEEEIETLCGTVVLEQFSPENGGCIQGTEEARWCQPRNDGVHWGRELECIASDAGVVYVGLLTHGVELVGEHATWRRESVLLDAELGNESSILADSGLERESFLTDVELELCRQALTAYYPNGLDGCVDASAGSQQDDGVVTGKR